MTTKFIGLREFRQNIATFTKMAKEKNIRFIILKKNIPVLEIKAVNESTITLEKLTDEIKKARTQVKQGKVITHDQIMQEFGLK